MPERAGTRILSPALIAALLVTACARDVVDKPAARSVVDAGAEFAGKAHTYYAGIVDGLNASQYDLVARNRGCRWGRTLTLHTPETMAAAIAHRAKLLAARRDALADERAAIVARFPADGCLTSDELALVLARQLQPRELRLQLTSDAAFTTEARTLAALSRYSAVLADLASEPKPHVTQDLRALADELISIQADAQTVASALDGTGAAANDFNLKPLREELGRIGTLIDLVKGIIQNAEDDRRLRRVAIASAPAVNAQIALIRASLIGNYKSYVEFAQGQAITQSELQDRAADSPFVERRALIAGQARSELEAAHRLALLKAQRAAGDDPAKAVLPEVRAADALTAANDNLVRVAEGRYTAAEKRSIARATIKRVRSVFVAAAAAFGGLGV
ncbi:MAG: hypothetical protein RQ833_02535 [Sphingomonadaceae bacterium]|nr:hypothetical protein [Sphingomonadaceae bacterium]